MNEKEEQAYIQGQKALASRLLRTLMSELDPEERTLAHLQTERQEAIVELRSLCEEFGDNDWPDNLYLSDIIEKHLGRHLRG